VRVVQERTWGGRLFQTVGAAVRKAREPNDKLDRATDNMLAEADRKALHGLCWWSKLARYGGLPVFKALKVCGNTQSSPHAIHRHATYWRLMQQLTEIISTGIKRNVQWRLGKLRQTYIQCESKNHPEVFWHFFQNGWEFFFRIVQAHYMFQSTLDYKFLFN